MKKILCFLLCLPLAFGLCSCSKSELEGTWQAEITYKQLTAGQVTAGLGKFAEYLSGLDSVSLHYSYQFNSDGTYSENCDIETFLKDMNSVLKSGITAYYTDYIKENKLNISLQDAMAADGITAGDLIDESTVASYTPHKGNFKVEDNKLYLSASLDTAIDEKVFTEFELSGNKLTLKKSVGANFSVASMLPLTFSKID